MNIGVLNIATIITMPNPYDKYLSKEDHLHRACCDWLDLQFKGLHYTHPANEGKRTSFEQHKAKALRMKPGVPDLLIFEPKGSFAGLAVELKYGKNKPTAEQFAFLEQLGKRNWKTAIIYSIDNFIELVNEYMYQ